jgi:hypothetical protein
MGFNYRIIKLSDNFIQRGYLGSNRYRYLLTEGYNSLNNDIRVMIIEYCPTCGKNLSKFYSSDEYINEKQHPW